jgi:hypothetical protein
MEKSDEKAFADSLLRYFWIKGWLTDEEYERISKKNAISLCV